MSQKPQPTTRGDYRKFCSIETRWHDNDVYGHVNNVVYYSYFDTAVNRHLIEEGVLDIAKSPIIGLVIESHCTYFSPLEFPDTVTVGLKVVHLGNSSVRYEIALFRNDKDIASAIGNFVHVYVDRGTNSPVSIPASLRNVLKALEA